MADDGEYLCVGSSELGTVMTRAILTVIGEYFLLSYVKPTSNIFILGIMIN